MDDCCRNLQPRPVQKQTGRCHSCNQRGKPVAHETVEALIKPEFRDPVNGRAYASARPRPVKPINRLTGNCATASRRMHQGSEGEHSRRFNFLEA